MLVYWWWRYRRGRYSSSFCRYFEVRHLQSSTIYVPSICVCVCILGRTIVIRGCRRIYSCHRFGVPDWSRHPYTSETDWRRRKERYDRTAGKNKDRGCLGHLRCWEEGGVGHSSTKWVILAVKMASFMWSETPTRRRILLFSWEVDIDNIITFCMTGRLLVAATNESSTQQLEDAVCLSRVEL